MSFQRLEPRTDDHGTWVLYSYGERPAVQMFFPTGWVPARPFSVFWLGSADPDVAFQFLEDKIAPDRTDVKIRLINRFGISELSFPREDEFSEKWDLKRSPQRLGNRCFPPCLPQLPFAIPIRQTFSPAYIFGLLWRTRRQGLVVLTTKPTSQIWVCERTWRSGPRSDGSNRCQD